MRAIRLWRWVVSEVSRRIQERRYALGRQAQEFHTLEVDDHIGGEITGVGELTCELSESSQAGGNGCEGRHSVTAHEWRARLSREDLVILGTEYLPRSICDIHCRLKMFKWFNETKH